MCSHKKVTETDNKMEIKFTPEEIISFFKEYDPPVLPEAFGPTFCPEAQKPNNEKLPKSYKCRNNLICSRRQNKGAKNAKNIKNDKNKTKIKEEVPKAEIKEEDSKIEAREEDSKIEVKKEDSKIEVKEEDSKAEVKEEVPKAEVKEEVPKIEIKEEVPKAEAKEEILKVEFEEGFQKEDDAKEEVIGKIINQKKTIQRSFESIMEKEKEDNKKEKILKQKEIKEQTEVKNVKQEKTPEIPLHNWNGSVSNVKPISISGVLASESAKIKQQQNQNSKPKSKSNSRKSEKVVMSFQELQKSMNKPSQWNNQITGNDNVSFSQLLSNEQKNVQSKPNKSTTQNKKGKKSKPIVISLEDFNSQKQQIVQPPKQKTQMPSFNSLMEAEKHSESFTVTTAPGQNKKNHRRGKQQPYVIPEQEEPAWEKPDKSVKKESISDILSTQSHDEQPKQTQPKQTQPKQQNKKKQKVVTYSLQEFLQNENKSTQNKPKVEKQTITQKKKKTNFNDLYAAEKSRVQKQESDDDDNYPFATSINYNKKPSQNKISFSELMKQQTVKKSAEEITKYNPKPKQATKSFNQLISQELQRAETSTPNYVEDEYVIQPENQNKPKIKERLDSENEQLFWGKLTKADQMDNSTPSSKNSPEKYLLRLIEEATFEEGLEEFAESLSKSKTINELIRNLSTIMTQQQASVIANKFFRRYPH